MGWYGSTEQRTRFKLLTGCGTSITLVTGYLNIEHENAVTSYKLLVFHQNSYLEFDRCLCPVRVSRSSIVAVC